MLADSSDMVFFFFLRKTAISQWPLLVITFPSLRAVFAGRSVTGERPFIFSVLASPPGGHMPVDSSMKPQNGENMRRHWCLEEKIILFALAPKKYRAGYPFH